MSMQDQTLPAANGVPIAPVPTNWSLNTGQTSTGEKVVVIMVGTPLGQFTYIIPAENAVAIGQRLIEAGTGGLQIATALPPEPPPSPLIR